MIFTFEGAFSSEELISSPKVSYTSLEQPLILEGNLEDELGMLDDFQFDRLGVDEICHVE